ncbi:MAG: hypothetical protein RR893_13595, partial [Clostridia bacterium]
EATEAVEATSAADTEATADKADTAGPADPADPAEALLKLLREKHITPFVHGRGKRKSELQRDIEELAELLARKRKYAVYQVTFKGRNSFSKTDSDATFTRM